MHLYLAKNLIGMLREALGLDIESGSGAVFVVAMIFVGCMVIPYLLGSINPAIIFSKLLYNDDIRKHGSGNAGSTNTLRTFGKKAAALVFSCDLIKAGIAVFIGGLLFADEGAAIAGLFAVIGHMFPIYYRFKGGKGVACTAMVVLMINPISFGILLVVFIILVAGTKYVSLGSIISVMLYPVVLNSVYNIYNKILSESSRNPDATPAGGMAQICAVLIAVLVVFMHRANIKRLFNGTESKISFKKKNPKPVAEDVSESVSNGDGESEGGFVKCEGCKRLIPVGREFCAYCKTENKNYNAKFDVYKRKKK